MCEIHENHMCALMIDCVVRYVKVWGYLCLSKM